MSFFKKVLGKKQKDKGEAQSPATTEIKSEIVEEGKSNAPKADAPAKADIKSTEEKKPAEKAVVKEAVKSTDKKAEKKQGKEAKAKEAAPAEDKKPLGKFAVTKSADDRFMFNLKAANSFVIATSGMYTTLASCKTGIASVATNAPIAALEDQTIEGYDSVSNPKFELYLDNGENFRFRLKARNGEIIAVSQGYKSKANCKNGIESVRANANAPTVCEFEDEQ